MNGLHASKIVPLIRATEPLSLVAPDVEGQLWPLVPEGTHEASYLYHETCLVPQFRTKSNPDGTPKVFLHFRIQDPGPYFEVELFASYNVTDLKGKPGRYGGVVLPKNGYLRKDYERVTGADCRRDRVNLKRLNEYLIEVQVVTVKVDLYGETVPPQSQYSRVSRMLRALAGGSSE